MKRPSIRGSIASTIISGTSAVSTGAKVIEKSFQLIELELDSLLEERRYELLQEKIERETKTAEKL